MSLCTIKGRHIHEFWGTHADASHLQGHDPRCTCYAGEFDPHKSRCPVSIDARKRLRELHREADDLGIGYGVEL